MVEAMPENARDRETEKVLVYIGPSLSLDKARQILPNAIYRPPARQGDIVTDLVNLNPTHVLLGDGTFNENLSVWHKELVYALQYPTVKGVYGFSSMGALRASELDFVGMVGIGQIYEWYRDGVTDDDSEVALLYASREGPEGPLYYPNTVPLCDIRAGAEHYEREFPGREVATQARQFFELMREVHYTRRTQDCCEQRWDGRCGVYFPCIPQKSIDAIQALTSFSQAKSEPKLKPAPADLSIHFQALFDRDRRISINGQHIPQQHVDSYVLLHHPEYERICWDAANQDLALMLCNVLGITIGLEDVARENARFQQRCGIESLPDFEHMLENNGWSKSEYDRLMIQNARIRKLQHALSISKCGRRNTQAILDYLRTHQGFDYWAVQAAQAEGVIQREGIEDWLEIDLDKTVWTTLAEHFEQEGLELKSSPEEYLLETGFTNQNELSIALARISALRKERDNG
jgi:hypothetical protein